MEFFLRFANLPFFLVAVTVAVIFTVLRLRWHRRATYGYSLATQLKNRYGAHGHWHRALFFLFRLFSLLTLSFLIGRPQLVDPRSNILVEGIDIMLVLDVSGSMQFRDYGDDKQSRVDIAKKEAIRFIEKRVHDPIGLVIFGKDAVSRCPITADKNILTSIVKELHIGSIDPDGTVLSLAILTAANRLKDSKSKSKVMIVLTDGEPSPWDERPEVATEVARRMGIKIYTVGIGSDKEQVIMHPLYGMIQKPKVNNKLLKEMAQRAGGKFFLAENQKDMRNIYDTIDRLEKTEYEVDLFSRYKEFFMPFFWFIIAFVLLEILLSSLIWFGL